MRRRCTCSSAASDAWTTVRGRRIAPPCCSHAVLTWTRAAPATPQPAQSASDEADEALAAVLLGDAEEMSDETQRDAAPSS